MKITPVRILDCFGVLVFVGVVAAVCPPDPMPTCSNWGGFVIRAGVCCEETVSACRFYNVDIYSCIAPKAEQGYKNGSWGDWMQGYACDGATCH